MGVDWASRIIYRESWLISEGQFCDSAVPSPLGGLSCPDTCVSLSRCNLHCFSVEAVAQSLLVELMFLM